MIQLIDEDFNEQVKNSADYKLVIKFGCLYIMPAGLSGTVLNNLHSQVWDDIAVLIVDASGQVIKNRYGPVAAIRQ